MILVGLLAFISMLHFGRSILVPIALAVVIGLMFGPYADRLERAGLAPPVSAIVVVISFLLLIFACAAAFAVPLSDWVNRLPVIWERVRGIIADWQGFVESASELGEDLKSMMGDGGNMTVTVDEGSPAANLAFLAPNLIGQLLVFLASLYFFVSCRHQIRVAILRLCIGRRLRWRVAHIFRDAETMVSRYLVSITLINIGLGMAVAIGMALVGVPSPLLWGLMAAVLNYVVYIGPAVMVIILLGVGLATFSSLLGIVTPALVFLGLNFIEGQFATPQMLGRQLTINPFIVFLALVFWLWIWGPVGGFIAVPILLVTSVALSHILPLVPTGTNADRQNAGTGR